MDNKLFVDNLKLMSYSLKRKIIVTTLKLLFDYYHHIFSIILNFFQIKEGKYTTTWSGQYRKDNENEEVLLTTWIMTSNVPEANVYWEATNVGQDRFTRNPPKQPKQGRKSLAKF